MSVYFPPRRRRRDYIRVLNLSSGVKLREKLRMNEANEITWRLDSFFFRSRHDKVRERRISSDEVDFLNGVAWQVIEGLRWFLRDYILDSLSN